MSLFDELCQLLGRTIDDPVLADFLARHPDHKIGKPDGGDQYIVFRDGGFDLLLRAPAPRRPRAVHRLFLFRDGEERHRAFGDLPHGIAFTDRHADLVARFGAPSRDSRAALGSLFWAEWGVDAFTLYFRYDSVEGAPRHIIVGPRRDESTV